MPRPIQNLLVTGGAGFIGVNFIRWLFEQPDCPARIVNVDKLTYAGNPLSLLDTRRAPATATSSSRPTSAMPPR
jgi:dTDP-D-glucose 4,6-dehydratase